jgi:hypothetical protein
MSRPPASPDRLIRSGELLRHLADLVRAFGLEPEGAIPFSLVAKATESVRAALPFADLVGEETLLDILGCTRPTLRKYIDIGLRVIRIDRRKWYSVASVETWLRGHEHSTDLGPRRPGRPRRPEAPAAIARGPP